MPATHPVSWETMHWRQDVTGHLTRSHPSHHTLSPQVDYIVVTKDPDALAAAYPDAPRETFVKASLPRLLNQSGLIGLLLGDDGLVVDLLHYDSNLLPKGMKSKAGIALERKDYQVIEEAGNWYAASRSAGFATPGRKNSSPRG